MASILSSWRGLKPDTLQPKLEFTRTWDQSGGRTIDQTKKRKKKSCAKPPAGVQSAYCILGQLIVHENKRLSLSPCHVQQGNPVSSPAQGKEAWNLDVTLWSFLTFGLPPVAKAFQQSFLESVGLNGVCSPTLCAASRLWTKPISVRYFIPDATPVSMSISCMTLSWPSCFWGRRENEKRRWRWKTKPFHCAKIIFLRLNEGKN